MVFLGSDSDNATNQLDESALWFSSNPAMFQNKANTVGVLATENEDVRSLRELLVLGNIGSIPKSTRCRTV